MVVVADKVILFGRVGKQETTLDVFELLLLTLKIVRMPVAVDTAAGLRCCRCAVCQSLLIPFLDERLQHSAIGLDWLIRPVLVRRMREKICREEGLNGAHGW